MNVGECFNLRISSKLQLREVVLGAVDLLLASVDTRPDAGIAFAIAKFAETLVHVVHFKTPGMDILGYGLADAFGLRVERMGYGRLIEDGVAVLVLL